MCRKQKNIAFKDTSSEKSEWEEKLSSTLLLLLSLHELPQTGHGISLANSQSRDIRLRYRVVEF